MVQIILLGVAVFLGIIFIYYLYEGRYERVEEIVELKGEVVSKYHAVEPQMIYADEMAAPIEHLREIYEIMIESNGAIYEGEGVHLYNQVEENEKVSFKLKKTYKKLKESDQKSLIKQEILEIVKGKKKAKKKASKKAVKKKKTKKK